jgi:hypothetical protein
MQPGPSRLRAKLEGQGYRPEIMRRSYIVDAKTGKLSWRHIDLLDGYEGA